MVSSDKALAFRAQALEKGLIYDYCPEVNANEQVYFFDLASGAIYCKREAKVIKELIELAFAHAESPDCGEHLELLDLCAEFFYFDRNERAQPVLEWRRGIVEEMDVAISLGRWLTQEQQIPNLNQNAQQGTTRMKTKTTKKIAITGENRHEVVMPKDAQIIGVRGQCIIVEFDPDVKDTVTVVFHSSQIGQTVPMHFKRVGFLNENNTESGELVLWQES